ncbi:MAG TPA: THUMP domain-containing protein [Ramlibacter sp.]|uniref:THUMP domain-containing class I SAM-dependent RNA methyltransferase n=1 Tax=Ramlibacter sp. TaxID=1917967 RepID=UPI002CE1BD26|nr:THUMP domain-containing protein [Ramlibacter sp.]HVZ46170.1 THUMP domain-containing protein [Ramlibacter sp.]
MSLANLFLPCAGGVEEYLLAETRRIGGEGAQAVRGGVQLRADWTDVMRLNLRSRLAQRVLIQLAKRGYRGEDDLYEAASGVAWETWFTPRQTFKVEVTAQMSPLKSLNFAALRIKDGLVDRFRGRGGVRPDVETRHPDVRVFAHLTADTVTLYIDTSGEPLFKRGWREDKGEAPLKETLAAAIIAASGWDASLPLYDPCCGSGTIVIEAAQIACGIAPGLLRRFGFERLAASVPRDWQRLKEEAQAERNVVPVEVHGSDVAFRMVDFAQRNAHRAGVGDVVKLRGGDALQRMPPTSEPGVMLLNPPYGERIEAGGVAGAGRVGRVGRMGRETAQSDAAAGDFFAQLAAHWKKHYAGWTAWMLSPDLKLPTRMRLKESRRVPMWNGPIECRLFRFDMVKGSARASAGA